MSLIHELPNQTTTIKGRYAAVSSAANGTEKVLGDDLLTEASQETAVNNLAPAFDSTATYAVGDFVSYQGKIYQFTSTHTGAWNASHATVSGQNALLKVTAQYAKSYCCYTDSVANGENIASIDLSYSGQIVFTFRMATAITESGLIILNKTGTSANTSIIVISKANVGTLFKLYVDSNGSCIIKNISGSALDVKIMSATDRWDLKHENPTHWDSETAIEYGVVYNVSPEEGFDYESVRTFSVLANENIASIDTSYSGQIIFSFRTIAAITENGFVILNKTGTSSNTSIIVVSKENVGIPFKLFVDSNGSSIIKNVSGSALDVKIVSATDRWDLKRENPIHWEPESANEYGVVYNLTPQASFDYGSVRTFSVLSNENVASIDYSYSGQIIFSFRMATAITESGFAILNKTGTSANTSIIIISKENVGFPFKLYVDSNGSSIIKNVSGSAIDVKIISATDRWDLKRENPTHWDAGTATEYGFVYNLAPSRYSNAAKANIHSLKYVVNASRYNKDLNDKHDFTFCIVTDSHDDWRSVYHAVDITNDFLPIDICIHCGDAMGNVYEYGRTQVDQWNTSVAMAKKPIYFVVGNHESGTYPNIAFSPTQAQLYNAFIKPLVDKGFIVNGEYTVDKCYYFHDFVNSKIRLIVLNEFEAPQDIDDTYWEPVTYDSSKPNITANTAYNTDDIVNVDGYNMYSFRCKNNINTGVYYSGYWPKYKILGKSRWFTKTQLDWFYNVLNTTPEDYSVVIALHQPVSPNSKNQSSMMFGDTEFGNNAPGIHIQSVMSGDVIADIINAFKTKGTYSATIQGTGDGAYLTPFSVSYDFSLANSVNNIITIGGHAHKDLLWKHDAYEYLFNVTPTTANTAISGNAGYKLSNEMRLKTTESDYCCDALTCISFGYSNRIALTKIGVDVTIDAEPRNFQIINN